MRHYEGAGIGLTLAKGYAELLNGKLWLKSEFGKGSSFYVSFSFKHSEKHSHAKSDQKKHKLSEKNAKIIIAEDEESNYFYLEALFKNLSYEVTWVKNGKDLIHELQKKSYNLILLDIKMPVMDGYQVLEYLVSQKINIPVIAQTAYYSEEDEILLKKMGASDYISKPIKKKDLLELIEKHI
jgi:CheY-like chemotaxis protein